MEGTVLEMTTALVQVTDDGQQYAAIFPEERLQAIFAGDGLNQITAKVRELALADPAAVDPTTLMQTAKGRTAIKSLAFKVTRTKTYLDNKGKDYVAALKALPRLIDENRRIMREDLDALAAKIRQPITADEDRVEAHRARLQLIREMPLKVQGGTDADVAKQIDTLGGMPLTAEAWEEFLPEATEIANRTLQVLNEAYATKQKAAADAVELERLRREATQRDARDAEDKRVREAADRARREAEERAERERQATLGREAEANRAAELARQRAEQAEAEANKLKADNLYREIREYVAGELVEVGASQIQRRFNLSYAHAVEAMDRLEAGGIIGDVDGSGKRKALKANQETAVITTDRMQGVDCAKYEEETPHIHAAPPAYVKAAHPEDATAIEARPPAPDHRKQYNSEAADDIMAVIAEMARTSAPETLYINTARAIAKAIIKGQIRHVSISY